MMTLATFLFLSMGLFALSGLLRGWYKEFLATVGAVVGVLVITLTEKYLPAFNNFAPKVYFLSRAAVFGLMVFFGYQTPRFRSAKQNLSGLASVFLGTVLGALNGYLIIGMLWHYLDVAGYPWPHIIAPPPASDTLSQTVLTYLPNTFLGVPGIYIVSALLFVFMIVVMI